jgi:hypothetical protein
MCPTGTYTYILLQHSPGGMLHIYRYVQVSAYGTYIMPTLHTTEESTWKCTMVAYKTSQMYTPGAIGGA